MNESVEPVSLPPSGYAVGRAEPIGPRTDQRPRCRYCGRMVAYYATRPWRIKCGKCGAVTSAE